jgi:MinD-like ATPase involved in chromosome partitioning or flagellar assembly
MASERFVVLGVAQVRSPWFREVARWATSAMLPVEFVKAMSVEEVRVRLRSGRGYSALLVDDSLVGVDRDLVELAREAGCAVLIVDSGRGSRQWSELGASALLPATFERDELVQVLRQVAMPITRSVGGTAPPAQARESMGFRGRLVAVTGVPGAGRSTIAAALAQGLASDPRHTELVCLADLALDADHAMLHGSPDVVPGLIELVEGHRLGTPSIDDVRGMTWNVNARGYHLLLGLRRHRDWTAVRPRAFGAALDGLRRGFRIVVADVDADIEGEQATGSLDVEERNAISRATISAADVVLIVGLPGLKGIHSHLRTTRAMLAHGVPAGRLLPIINRSPKGPRARAELTAAFGTLLAGDGAGVPSPLHLPERRHLDEIHRDGTRFADGWLSPVVSAVQAILDRDGEPDEVGATPTLEPVRPGSLGAWTDDSGPS